MVFDAIKLIMPSCEALKAAAERASQKEAESKSQDQTVTETAEGGGGGGAAMVIVPIILMCGLSAFAMFKLKKAIVRDSSLRDDLQ